VDPVPEQSTRKESRDFDSGFSRQSKIKHYAARDDHRAPSALFQSVWSGDACQALLNEDIFSDECIEFIYETPLTKPTNTRGDVEEADNVVIRKKKSKRSTTLKKFVCKMLSSDSPRNRDQRAIAKDDASVASLDTEDESMGFTTLTTPTGSSSKSIRFADEVEGRELVTIHTWVRQEENLGARKRKKKNRRHERLRTAKHVLCRIEI
jgi:hypothetical protein